MQRTFFILTLLVLSQISPVAQTPLDNIALSCSNTYKIDDLASLEEWRIYTGTNAGIKTYQLTIPGQVKKTKWEKKKADRNCLSADPNDCMVWCLVEIPARPTEVFEVVHSSTPSADISSLPTITSEESYIVMDEVCKIDYNQKTLNQLSQILHNQGYLGKQKEFKQLSGRLLKALNQMQEDFFLPIGQLNGPTLKVLQQLLI